jgi:hypothetical protein
MRIFEEVHVTDADGREVAAYTRELDPRAYVSISIPLEAVSVTGG